MLQPQKFYGTLGPAIAVLIVCAVFTALIIFIDDVGRHRGESDGWWIILPLALIWAGWFIWRRWRYPMLTLTDDRLCVNPNTASGKEQCIPLEKVQSIRLGTYTIVGWTPASGKTREDVEAFYITTVDGRRVPPLLSYRVRRGLQDDFTQFMTELNHEVENRALNGMVPSTAGTLFSNSHLQLRHGERRQEVMARFSSHSLESYGVANASGYTVTVADVVLWDLYGYLRAEFDKHDTLVEATWNSTPGLRIDEGVVWEIIDDMERSYGSSTGDVALGWGRSDNGIEKILQASWVRSSELYELSYSERTVDTEKDTIEYL
jgi:hypothetical protein